jgi:hypothetical protein
VTNRTCQKLGSLRAELRPLRLGNLDGAGAGVLTRFVKVCACLSDDLLRLAVSAPFSPDVEEREGGAVTTGALAETLLFAEEPSSTAVGWSIGAIGATEPEDWNEAPDPRSTAP